CVLLAIFFSCNPFKNIVSRNSKRKINHKTGREIMDREFAKIPSLFIYLEGHCIQMAKGMCIEAPATFHPKCALCHTNDLRSVRLQIRGHESGDVQKLNFRFAFSAKSSKIGVVR